MGRGVESGLAAYLCWALSREIDPDYPVSANLAALAGGGLALWLDSHAGVLFVMLLVIKVMVGSSGLAPARWKQDYWVWEPWCSPAPKPAGGRGL